MGIEKPNKSKLLKIKSKWLYTADENIEPSDGVRNLSTNDLKLDSYKRKLKDRAIDSLIKTSSIYSEKIFSKPFDYNLKKTLSVIMAEYFDNKFEVIYFSNIGSAIKDFNFIDFIVEKKVPFTCYKNQEEIESISEAFLYLSNKKALGRGGNKNAGKNIIEPANEFSKKIGPIIDLLETNGYKSLQLKADELNRLEVKTLRGKEWSSMTVKRTWERWKKLKEIDNQSSNSEQAKTPKPE